MYVVMDLKQEKDARSSADYKDIALTDPRIGLTSRQAEDISREFGDNSGAQAKTKSIAAILKENIFTFFNILNACLAALIIFAGAYSELVFLLVIISNLAIGLIQEIKAKRTLDKLSLLTMGKVRVIRDGAQSEIHSSKIVTGDILVIKIGDQLPCDCLLRSGELEANESLLSGESDDILKTQGDLLYSGSIVVSGEALAQAVSVGKNSFAGKISADAKADKKTPSKIRDSIKKILKIVSVIVIPLGALIFTRQYAIGDLDLNDNIVRTAASMIGMIPEGLFLLTAVALCAGAIILAYKKTLVKDMYAIESLAYSDTLCLDKTGTLTLGAMTVDSVESLDRSLDVKKLLGHLTYALKDDNSTMAAIKKAYPAVENKTLIKTVPFSSKRKYSAAVFSDIGSLILGAYEFIFGEDQSDAKQMYYKLTEGGKRVLTLAISKNQIVADEIPEDVYPAAFVVISDKIKPSAKRTIEYFYSQGVDIKIISGDHPKTVSSVAESCGVKNAAQSVDASLISDEQELEKAVLKYTVFGRVSPNQKKSMVAALKKAGHTVAMTGDGVNDVPALREADCSIAMASGSRAAANVSTMTLLNSDFDSMPLVVNEGRKAVNNLQRSAALFITKTIYAVLAAFLSMFALSCGYPFTPMQITILSLATIGFPAFFLAFEPNYSPIRGSFLGNVFSRSLPGGLMAALGIILCDVYGRYMGADYSRISSLCLMVTFITGFAVLVKICLPLNKYRLVIILISAAIFLLFYFGAPDFLGIARLPQSDLIFLLCAAVVMPSLLIPVNMLFNRIFGIKKDKGRKGK